MKKHTHFWNHTHIFLTCATGLSFWGVRLHGHASAHIYLHVCEETLNSNIDIIRCLIVMSLFFCFAFSIFSATCCSIIIYFTVNSSYIIWIARLRKTSAVQGAMIAHLQLLGLLRMRSSCLQWHIVEDEILVRGTVHITHDGFPMSR